MMRLMIIFLLLGASYGLKDSKDKQQCIGKCPPLGGLDTYLPHQDCSKFCHCTHFDVVVQDCPPGLNFNPRWMVCDWPESAGCKQLESTTEGHASTNLELGSLGTVTGNSGTTSDILTTGILESTTLGNIEQEASLSSSKEPINTDNMETSHVTDVAESGSSTTELGVMETITSEITHNMVTTLETTESIQVNSTLESFTTSSIDLSSVSNENGCIGTCPTVPVEINTHLANVDCSKYCHCGNNGTTIKSCPVGLHFDKVLQVCEWPDTAGCVGNTTVSSSSTKPTNISITQVTSEIPESTTNLTTELVGSSTTSSEKSTVPEFTTSTEAENTQPTNVITISSNTELVTNSTVVTTIVPLTIQNSIILTESSTLNTTVTEDLSVTTDKEILTSTALIQSGCIGTCPSIPITNNTHLANQDCSKFCHCSNQGIVVKNCLSGLHFNSVLQVCDWPDRAGCLGNNIIEVSNTVPSSTDNESIGTTIPQLGSTEVPTTVTMTVSSKETTQLTKTTTLDGESTNVSETSENVITSKMTTSTSQPDKPTTQTSMMSTESTTFETPVVTTTSSTITTQPVTTTTDKQSVNSTLSTTEFVNHTESSTVIPTEMEVTTNNSSSSQLSSDHGCIGVCPAIPLQNNTHIPNQDCTKFCHCSNQGIVVKNCPSGLHFNSNLQVCDLPENAGCIDTVTSETTTDLSKISITPSLSPFNETNASEINSTNQNLMKTTIPIPITSESSTVMT